MSGDERSGGGRSASTSGSKSNSSVKGMAGASVSLRCRKKKRVVTLAERKDSKKIIKNLSVKHLARDDEMDGALRRYAVVAGAMSKTMSEEKVSRGKKDAEGEEK